MQIDVLKAFANMWPLNVRKLIIQALARDAFYSFISVRRRVMARFRFIWQIKVLTFAIICDGNNAVCGCREEKTRRRRPKRPSVGLKLQQQAEKQKLAKLVA